MATATESTPTNLDGHTEYRLDLPTKPTPEREQSEERPTTTDTERARLKESLATYLASQEGTKNWNADYVKLLIDKIVAAYPEKSAVAEIVVEIFGFDEDLRCGVEALQELSQHQKMNISQYFVYEMKQPLKDPRDCPLDAKMYRRLLDIRRILLSCGFTLTRLELAGKAFFEIFLNPDVLSKHKNRIIVCHRICVAIQTLHEEELPEAILRDYVFRDMAASQCISILPNQTFPRAQEMSRVAMAWAKFCVSVRERSDEYYFAVVIDLTPQTTNPPFVFDGEATHVELSGEHGRDLSIESMKEVFVEIFESEEKDAGKWTDLSVHEEKENHSSRYFEVFDLLSWTRPFTRETPREAVADTFTNYPMTTVAFSVENRQGIQTVSMHAIGYKFPIFSTEIFEPIFGPFVGPGGCHFEEVIQFPNSEFDELMLQIDGGDQQR